MDTSTLNLKPPERLANVLLLIKIAMWTVLGLDGIRLFLATLFVGFVWQLSILLLVWALLLSSLLAFDGEKWRLALPVAWLALLVGLIPDVIHFFAKREQMSARDFVEVAAGLVWQRFLVLIFLVAAHLRYRLRAEILSREQTIDTNGA